MESIFMFLINEKIIFLFCWLLMLLVCWSGKPAHQQHLQGIVYAATNTYCLHRRLKWQTGFIVSLNNEQIF